jgi:membrane fusion protein (multidrug efflux system)
MRTTTIPRLSPIHSVAFFLCTALLLAPGCGGAKKESGHDPAPAGADVRIVPVEAVAVTRTTLTVTKQYSGSLEGEDQANIVTKIYERATTVRVKVGDRVRKGQILIELDKSGTSSQFFQAEASFKNAEKTLQRMKSLFSEGAVSAQTLDGAQTAYDVASANFDAARSVVELTSPIDGTVTAVNVTPGDLTNPGTVLATVARIEHLKVTFNMNEIDAPHVGIGQSVHIFAESRPGDRREGHVVQVSRSADVRSRSFEMKALFTNSSDLWFKPGMFVKVAVDMVSAQAVQVVPTEAIQTDGSTSRVFTVNNGKAQLRQVTIGISDGAKTEILSGLSDHDSVATVGANNLTDGIGVVVAAH